MKRHWGWMVLLWASSTATAAEWEFPVRHEHVLRDCSGTLRIDDGGVEYLTAHPKDARKWTFEEIRVLEIRSSKKVAVVSYEDQRRYLGKDRVFEFTLVEGTVPAELGAFLLERVKRPMVVSVFPPAEGAVYEVRVKHLGTVRGSFGVLRVFDDRVVFESEKDGDSRVWRLADIERFGHPDRFRFQITSHVPKPGRPREVYNFELLEDLPSGLYDYLWIRLNPSTYQP